MDTSTYQETSAERPHLPAFLQGWTKSTSPEWRGVASRYHQRPAALSSPFKIPEVEDKEFVFRECFEDLYQLVLRGFSESMPLVITGQRGIGKTVALFYVFFRFLSEMAGQNVLFVDGTTTYLFMDEEVYQCQTVDIEYLPEHSQRKLPFICFVRMGNASIKLPYILWKHNVVVQATSPTKDDHSRDELIDAFTRSLSARNFLTELDRAIRETSLDDCQDSATGTLRHLGGWQDSDAIRVALMNLEIYAIEMEFGPTTEGFEAADEPSSCAGDVLVNMDEMARVAVLVDNVVEIFAPVPRDVFEGILRPTETNQKLESGLRDFSIGQIKDIRTKIARESRCDLSEEIHRVVLFTGLPNGVTEFVQWRLGFESPVIRSRAVRQLVSTEGEKLVDLDGIYWEDFIVAPLADEIIESLTQTLDPY
ncbi:hypothetical protein PQX77_000387 [Marasmius sp. AFHP31]|nr:hypothetical protein PQX77_000387 [Marasmius sp. AFHP31]